MKKSLSTALGLAVFGAASLAAQVPLTDPDIARREEAEVKYIAAMKSDLRLLASAEEAYFVDNMAYFAGTVDARNPLYGFSPSKNVSVRVTGGGKDGSMWTATATHTLTATKCTWHLPDPIDCSAPAPPRTPTPSAPGATNGAPTAAEGGNGRVTALGSPRPVGLRPGESREWGFVVTPERSSCVVSGRVEGMASSDARLNVLIMTDSAYRDWRQGRWARTYYESGERSVITFEVQVTDPGRHVLVVSNPSKTSSKVVRMEQMHVACTE